jgi:hypothetical protein
VLLVLTAASTQSAELWQGSFKTADLWGAMELVVAPAGTASSLRARFTPNGHLETPVLREQAVSEKRVSFVTALAGTEYRFLGARRAERCSGTIETWKASSWNVGAYEALASNESEVHVNPRTNRSNGGWPHAVPLDR